MTWMVGWKYVQASQTSVACLAFKGLSLLLMVDYTLPCVYKDEIWLGEHGPISASFLKTKTSHPRGFWRCRNEPTLILDDFFSFLLRGIADVPHIYKNGRLILFKNMAAFWSLTSDTKGEQRAQAVDDKVWTRAINYWHLTTWKRMSCPTNQFIRGHKIPQDIRA